MEFEWDERKNRVNIRKHGFDFADAWEVFENPILEKLDDREDYGEDRWIAIGLLQEVVAVIAYTQPNERTVRVISLRKAARDEKEIYAKALQNRLGAD